MDYDNNATIAGQLHLVSRIGVDLWHTWAISGRAAILQIPHPLPESAEAKAELAELVRLAMRYSMFTPNEFESCILAAARAKQNTQWPKLMLIHIEEKLQEEGQKQRTDGAFALNQRNPVWVGTPSEALDRNWHRIWDESLRVSKERNERCRLFDFDYLDPYDKTQEDEIRLRDAAFVELKRRVVSKLGESDILRAKTLIRDEMIYRLKSMFPKYVGDIDSLIGNASFDGLDSASSQIYDLATQTGQSRFYKRVSRDDCSWAVYFDLYCEMMGCQWPIFAKEARAPKQVERQPMPNYGKMIAQIGKELRDAD